MYAFWCHRKDVWMIIETIMHLLNWNDIWYAHPGDFRTNLKQGRFHVGVWTGPQMDLICIRKANTNSEAEKYLSPGGRTILEATIKSVYKRMITFSLP